MRKVSIRGKCKIRTSRSRLKYAEQSTKNVVATNKLKIVQGLNRKTTKEVR